MTLNISVPVEMHEYILSECKYGSSVSEYIRSLVRREQQRRADYASRPILPPARANDSMVFAEALDQVEKLRAVLEKQDLYED